MSMNRLILLFLFTAFFNIFAKENSFTGTWVSEKNTFRNGYEFLQLSIQNEKFILAKLSYNQERNWEETRVLGIWEEIQGVYHLIPEMCTVYATKKLGLRWILIQGFDCDHLKIQITKNEQQIVISPSIGILDSIQLTKEKKVSSDAIDAIVVSKENNTLHAWSLLMRYIRKGSKATLNGKEIAILETVDSTGSFKTNEPFQIGDRILISNRKESGLFD
jgi:hypothetical protein